jgi:hypothetical protein
MTIILASVLTFFPFQQNQTHPFWTSGANHPTAAIDVPAVSNNSPVPLTKKQRRTLLHRHAVPKIDAACETEKTTKELIKHFYKFKIGERQEEDDSSSDDDDIPLSQLLRQTNVVGNPELKTNQTSRRFQPSQLGAPTTGVSRKAGKAVVMESKKTRQALAKRAHGR